MKKVFAKSKALLIISTAALVVVIGSSAVNAPQRVTHAIGSKVAKYNGANCTGCHGGGVAGGSIVLSGVPANTVAGQTYPVYITITDAVQTNWGFDMVINGGTFSTQTGSNVALETSKTNAHQTTAPAAPSPYVFDSLSWTAPATAGTVKFTFAGVAGNKNGKSSGDHSYSGSFTTTVALPMPVTIASFKASEAAGKISLIWATGTEQNTDHFEVERSTDGQNFALAGKVNAAGTSTTAKGYSYTEDATLFSGIAYYRLKSVDKSGAFTYSNTISVSLKQTNKFITNLYPNPLKAGQDIKLTYVSDKAETVSFQLINIEGKKINGTTIAVAAGASALSLPSTHTAGIYFVVVAVNDVTVQKMKVLVQ